MVSHDRYFLDKTAERLFAFEGGGRLRQYEGGYSDYLRVRQEEEKETPASAQAERPAAAKTEKIKTSRLKFTWQEQRDYETIESEIEKLEAQIASIDRQMELAATDFVRLNTLTGEKEAAEALLEEKLERYLYLSDLAERIEEQSR